MKFFKRFAAFAVSACLFVSVLSSCRPGSVLNPVIYTDVIISELMPNNSSTYADSSGRYSDWVELCNPTSREINLSGYGLSDDPNNPFKFTFPDCVLKPDEYFIVLLDGENRFNDGEMHCSFGISSAGGETVVLTSPSGKMLSSVAVAACPPDISVGLVQEKGDDYGSYVYFSTPTPKAPNAGTYTLAPPTEQADSKSDMVLLINEYMKSKNTVLLDEDGDYSAWVEIYNPGEQDVDLAGCYLSDDAGEKDKWKFPQEATVPAGGYLLVYLSDKDKVSPSGEIHASFKLSSTDTALVLSDKLLRTVDSVTPVQLGETLSYGRSAGDSDVWLYYTRPTPGAANTTPGFADLSTGAVTALTDTVYISEVMSLNDKTHKSPSGDYTDWIELHNPTDADVDLAGWYVSDNLDEPLLYELPSGTSISAGGYLVLYASGMAGTGKKGEIHLPFSVSAQGETLVLTSPSRLVADVFQTGKLRQEMSSGRAESGERCRVFFSECTPGKANSSECFPGYSQEPVFSSDGGCMKEDSVTVELSAPEGAVIYYSVDGTEPGPSSFLYTVPIYINSNCSLRAVCIEDGKLASDIVTRTYIFGESHDIPVVCLSSDPDGLFSESNGIYATGYGASDEYPYQGANFWKDWERAASFEYYTEDGRLGIAFNAGLSIHGQYSRALDQKSFKIKLRSKYGTPEVTYPFFKDCEVSTFKSFILRMGGQDYNSLKMRDAFFAQVIKGQMDLDFMDYRFCAVYINGEYWGLYCIREHTNADYIEAHHGIDADNVDLLKGTSAVKAGDKKAYLEFLDWIKTHDLTIQENFDYAAGKMDLDSWMNWWITETFFSNTDTGNIKFYCEKSDTGKWRWILYDLDWGMWSSTYHRNRLDKMLDPAGHGAGKMFTTVFARKLLANEDFKNYFIESYAYHLKTTFAPERTIAILDRMASEIRTEIPKNYERWHALSLKNWEKNVNLMKEMLTKRVEYSKQHLQDTFDLSDERMRELFPDWEG